MRKRIGAAAAAGALIGAVAMVMTGAFAASTDTLPAGGSMSLGCSGPSLSWAQTDATDGTATCANNPTTTTTTPPTTTPPTTTPPPPPPGACPQFLEAPSSAQAFCDTLGTPDPTAGTRSGALNGVLWGVSRVNQYDNPGQGVFDHWSDPSQQDQCGTTVSVQPDNDVSMCNGQLVESFSDGGYSGELAMYPRQPFDFAGRTGTVEFNVSNDTEGGHSAWPTFVLTDQPVPAPSDGSGMNTPGLFDMARNSIGVAFFANAPQSSCVSAFIYATSNYWAMSPGTHEDGCAQQPAETANGQPTQLNHVEIQVSPTGVKVFMGDVNNPASTHLIADSSFQVPLTRGLVWLADTHYNGNKFNNQGDHTFGWSDLAFDGPVLPRDLGFDVPDASPSNLGYQTPATMHTGNPVAATDIANASGALVEFNYGQPQGQTFTVSVDGSGPTTMQAPPSPGWGEETIAVPVPLTDVQAGAQTIKVSSSSGGDVANVDLILQGAGGVVAP